MALTCEYSIQKRLSNHAKLYILESLWSVVLDEHEFLERSKTYNTYFDCYENICRNCSPSDLGLLTHSGLLMAAKHAMKDTRDECIRILTESFRSTSNLNNNIAKCDEFAERWLALGVQALLLVDGRDWTGDLKLRDYLSTMQFSGSDQEDRFLIPRSFNLRNLDKIGGITIRWTDLVTEHLALEQDSKRLAVFHHRSILDTLKQSNLYPPRLFDETKWTFNILFPEFDLRCKEWYKHHELRREKRAPGSSATLDASATNTWELKGAQRNIRQSFFFRDRLISIKDEYDNHKPETFKQYLWDDRDPTRRWGFLIAALVFFFGMVQVIEGAIQCYKAYHPTPS